ncbi:MAG: YfcE family phosphodiesterase [Proteobacteria bacterium]|nr:YfcE family phosphodiesterase [Pseudomonadota bacterium]
MKIGVVSDTHNNLKNVGRIVELFNSHGVERVIHTGDITQAKTLDVFGQLHAPLYGVYGNNDQERDSLAAAVAGHGFNFQDPPLELIWHKRRILVVHDPLELDGQLNHQHELALHGHTHLYRYEQRAGQVIFNPGECAGHMSGFNAIGIVDLSDLHVELLRF